MEPHGLILKLNKEPLKELDPSVVAQDRRYWDGLSKELLANPKFLGNEWERGVFSKLRSAIGGVYTYRRMRSEAEVVYQQAVQLYPGDAQASFRLAELYMIAGRLDDAVAVLEGLKGHLRASDPLVDRAEAQITDLKRRAADQQSQ
jgi:tetratricopeptide (TPR) repeat protein